MSVAADLLKELLSLPVEQRASLADSLLKSLDAPIEGMDRIWKEEAHRRLEELRSGKVEPVPGEAVFERIRNRFAK